MLSQDETIKLVHLAQNGDEIYIGSKAGIPNGFNEVAKSYQ